MFLPQLEVLVSEPAIGMITTTMTITIWTLQTMSAPCSCCGSDSRLGAAGGRDVPAAAGGGLQAAQALWLHSGWLTWWAAGLNAMSTSQSCNSLATCCTKLCKDHQYAQVFLSWCF